jgi:putative tricarboxylic transport membrane protein
VVILAVVGALAVRNAPFDILVMFAAGLMGLVFVKYNYPLVSPVLGVIVGDIAETGFVQGWLLNQQSAMAFLTNSAVSIGLLLLIVLSLAVTFVKNYR